MAHQLPALVAEVGTLSSGTITLASAVTGFRTFSAALSNADTTDVVVRDASGTQASYPASTYNAGTLTLGSVDVSSGSIADGDVTVWVATETDAAWDGDITDINLDGGTDIGANLADVDLILVDDGAGGTNRKSALSRVWTYIAAKIAAAGYMTDVVDDTTPTLGGDLDAAEHELQDYSESLHTATISGTTTIDLANGMVQVLTLGASTAITLPASPGSVSRSFVLQIPGHATYAVTWEQTTPPLVWLGTADLATPPTLEGSGAINELGFRWDGSQWIGRLSGTGVAA